MGDSERNRDSDRATHRDDDGVEKIGDISPQPRVSTGGHMRPDAPGELPGDQHGAGTAERGRDRSAGLGQDLPHEGADIPDEDTIGGRTPAARAGREILDAIEEREPRGQ